MPTVKKFFLLCLSKPRHYENFKNRRNEVEYSGSKRLLWSLSKSSNDNTIAVGYAVVEDKETTE